MTEPQDDAELKRLEEESGGYGGPGVEAEETPEQRAADADAEREDESH